MQKQKRRVYVDGLFIELRLDNSGWHDASGNRYVGLASGKFVKATDFEKQSRLVPEGVVPELGKDFTFDGIVYQFQPKGPKGELIPVPVAKVPKSVSLGLADGTRSRIPAAPIRVK